MAMTLKCLFNESDQIYYAADGANGVPVALGAASSLQPKGQFYSINPINTLGWRGRATTQTTPRFALNVTRFQNFVFESDSDALDAQLAKWLSVAEKLPIATLTYSGSKSYHAVISMRDTLPFKPHTDQGILQYSQAWRALASHIMELGGPLLDPSTKDPARLTRLPGATRSNGVLQAAVTATCLKRYIDSEFILELCGKYPAPSITNACLTTFSGSLDELDRLLKERNTYLRDKLRYPKAWAGPENMYPELLRLTLWAIDLSGAPENILLAYLQKYTFPAILSAGYSRDLTQPVRNAYIWKGL